MKRLSTRNLSLRPNPLAVPFTLVMSVMFMTTASFAAPQTPQSQAPAQSPAQSQAPSVPNVVMPPGLDEGTETTLGPEQISEILAWAQNTEIALRELIETTRSLGYHDAKVTLVRGVQDVVLASAPRRTELLTRYVLNRALKLNAEIEAHSNPAQPGIVDIQVKLLRRSIDLALRWYVSDLAYLNGQLKKSDIIALPFAKFGLEYSEFLMSINQSVFDASAQYTVGLFALGVLQLDLYRDKNRLLLAPAIDKLYRFLKVAPAQAPARDQESVEWLRRIKKVYLDSIESASRLYSQAGPNADQGLHFPGSNPVAETGPRAGGFQGFVVPITLASTQLEHLKNVLQLCGPGDSSTYSCYSNLTDPNAGRSENLPPPLPAPLKIIRYGCEAYGAYQERGKCFQSLVSQLIAGNSFRATFSTACDAGSNHDADYLCLNAVFQQILRNSISLSFLELPPTEKEFLNTLHKGCESFGAYEQRAKCYRRAIKQLELGSKLDPIVATSSVCIDERGSWSDDYLCLNTVFGHSSFTALDPILATARHACELSSDYDSRGQCYSRALKSAIEKRRK